MIAYLACPYSHQDKKMMAVRFRMANVIAGILIKERGDVVFSPISHSHTIARDAGIDPLWTGWYEQDTVILGLCQKLYVLNIPGWRESSGVQKEIALAEKLGLPIEHLNPNNLMEKPERGRLKAAK